MDGKHEMDDDDGGKGNLKRAMHETTSCVLGELPYGQKEYSPTLLQEKHNNSFAIKTFFSFQ